MAIMIEVIGILLCQSDNSKGKQREQDNVDFERVHLFGDQQASSPHGGRKKVISFYQMKGNVEKEWKEAQQNWLSSSLASSAHGGKKKVIFYRLNLASLAKLEIEVNEKSHATFIVLLLGKKSMINGMCCNIGNIVLSLYICILSSALHSNYCILSQSYL